MTKKKSRVLRKAWDLVARSFTPMDKVRKSISKKLRLFKKAKSFRLHRHYNYAFIGEYQFSFSDSPLFLRARAPRKKWSRFLSLLLCGGAGSESIAEGVMEDELGILSPAANGVGGKRPEPSDSSEEDESVNRRAEKFIERFYEDIRIQRQKSLMRYEEMLHKSCS